jgi:hypothetical protein
MVKGTPNDIIIKLNAAAVAGRSGVAERFVGPLGGDV